ncbi:hypothetical protein COBT_001228 [Conglomerata obtusa]
MDNELLTAILHSYNKVLDELKRIRFDIRKLDEKCNSKKTKQPESVIRIEDTKSLNKNTGLFNIEKENQNEIVDVNKKRKTNSRKNSTRSIVKDNIVDDNDSCKENFAGNNLDAEGSQKIIDPINNAKTKKPSAKKQLSNKKKSLATAKKTLINEKLTVKDDNTKKNFLQEIEDEENY